MAAIAFFSSIGLVGVTDAAAVVVEALPDRTLPTGVGVLLPLPPATDDELVLDVGVDRLIVEDGFGGNPSLFFAVAEGLFAGLGVDAVRIVVAVMLSGGRPLTAGGLLAVAVDPVGGTLIEVVVFAVALFAAPDVAGAVERRDGISGLDGAGEFFVFGVEAGADVLAAAVVTVVVLGLAVGVDGPDFAPAAGLVAVLVMVEVAGEATGVELRVVRLADAVGVPLVPEPAVAVAVVVVLAGVVRMDVVVLAEAVARLAAAAAASAVLAVVAALALLAATLAAVAALLAAADVAAVGGTVVVDAGVP